MQRSPSIRWVLLNLILGVVGGVTLGWGPLAASTPVITALGLAGAMLGGGIGWRTRTRTQCRWVLVGHAVIVLAVALTAAIPLYRIGTLRWPGETRSANFERLWRALDSAYPYFEEKGVDPDALYARYASQAHQAQSDEDYWRLVAHMLAELNDGHTGVLSPSPQAGRRHFAVCRDIGGGSTHISDPIAGRLLSQPFTYGREHFRVRLPQRGWRPYFDYRVRPRGQTYTGPVILLIDAYNFSTAENFIVALVDSGRASTVGHTTRGGSGNPVGFALPGGGRARFSTGAFRRNDGRLIEGVGVRPDGYVTWTVEAFRAGRDPDLAAAERRLLDQ